MPRQRGHSNNIPTELFRSFLAISKHGSFAKAAEELNLTESEISAQMKRLQRLLGGDLLVKKAEGAGLTELGLVVESYAQRLLTPGGSPPSIPINISRRIVEPSSADAAPLVPAARANPHIVEELARRGYSEQELATLVVPKRTLARRRAASELLTVEETDKALRLKRIAAQAERVFGDSTKAHRWLRKPKRSLAGETPLAYLASEHGARIVEEMLGRIEHGIYA